MAKNPRENKNYMPGPSYPKMGKDFKKSDAKSSALKKKMGGKRISHKQDMKELGVLERKLSKDKEWNNQ